MFKGKSALVIGSTSGIGLGIATAFAARAANVTFNGFGDGTEIENIRAKLSADHGVEVYYDGADLSKQDDDHPHRRWLDRSTSARQMAIA